MNNKGLTLVELITTFALTAAIVVLLINVVVVIKNVYSNTTVKTELYIKQANLSNILNSKINYDNLTPYEECPEEYPYDVEMFCYGFANGDPDSLVVLTVNDRVIRFGDFVYELDEFVEVGVPEIFEEKSFWSLKIPITSKLYPNIDFGINLVYIDETEYEAS
ncbi:MAG: hypothetical protein E7174_04870 [Firmicutes bacterium]|nr:hypothetical protein [Bacillota bacterium]